MVQDGMDFWAGLISGAAGIVIGNPFDIIKLHLQLSENSRGKKNNNNNCKVDKWKISPLLYNLRQQQRHSKSIFFSPRNRKLNGLCRNKLWLVGIAAPIVGYGGLNGLLFMTYNRIVTFLNNNKTGSNSNENGSKTSASVISAHKKEDDRLWTTFVAGALGGLATWIISTPTEVIKCRAQAQIHRLTPTHDFGNIGNISTTSNVMQNQKQQYHHKTKTCISSWEITKKILRHEGIRGLYSGGVVTALRDSIGYGFYFWTYTITTRFFSQLMLDPKPSPSLSSSSSSSPPNKDIEVAKMLFCGGIAGVATWASIFPLDVIKSRVQTQLPDDEMMKMKKNLTTEASHSDILERRRGRLSAMQIFRTAYANEGPRFFFQGLTVCSIRAFIVNAVQWSVYEWIMQKS